LVVGVGDHATRDAQIGREAPGRREPRSGDEPALLDGFAQRGTEVPPQVATPQVDVEEDVAPARGLIRACADSCSHDANDRTAPRTGEGRSGAP
jgi:hypothetical protein